MSPTLNNASEAHEKSNRPIRVCHVSVSLNTGGLERILAGLAKHTPSDECMMSFVALREGGRFANELQTMGAQVTVLQSKHRVDMVRQFRTLLKAGLFNIVHTHNTYPHLYGTLAARLAGVPIVVNTRHGQRIGHHWKSRTLFRFASRWVDRVIAVSDDAAQLSIEKDGLPKSKVTRIWNGIDVNEFEYREPTRLPLAVTVGRLAPEKGLDTLIRSMAIALASRPELRLRVVGDGPMRVELERLCAELKVQQSIEFVGEKKNVAEALEGCGFYVSTSLSEGISLTLLEAMSVGLPVVATRVGGNPEIVVDGVTGHLVPPNDPRIFAESILRLCENMERWGDMGIEARKRVVEYFDVRHMVQGYQRLYRELLQGSHR